MGLWDSKLQEIQGLLDMGLDQKTLGRMSFNQLARMRDKYGQDARVSALLAPYERQAFARQWVRDNPMLAAPSLMAAIPAEQLAKVAGVMPKSGANLQTPASMEQLRRSFIGLGEGLLSHLGQKPYYATDDEQYK